MRKNGNYSQNEHHNFLKLLYKVDNSLILYCRTKILVSFIIENAISFSAVEWGIKDPVDKLTCDNSKVGCTHG